MNFEVYTPKQKSTQVIMGEIQALERLVSLRRNWLTQPQNQQRSTYRAILNDTRRLEHQLSELRKDLDARMFVQNLK